MNDEDENFEDEEPCLCQDFVPENKRIDFIQYVLDSKSGKHKWKVVMRAHQDCPEHGIRVVKGD